MDLNFAFATVGITLTLLGALFAAFSFINTSNNDLLEQAGTYWGYNLKLLEALVKQRDTAVLGFVLIFLGSLLQVASYFVSNNSFVLSHSNYIALLIISAVLLFGFLKWLIGKISLRNINIGAIPLQLKTYYELKEDVEKQKANENKPKEAIQRKSDMVRRIGKRLCVDEKGMEFELYEEKVIKMAEQYLNKK